MTDVVELPWALIPMFFMLDFPLPPFPLTPSERPRSAILVNCKPTCRDCRATDAAAPWPHDCAESFEPCNSHMLKGRAAADPSENEYFSTSLFNEYSTPSLYLPICVSGTPRAVITFRNSGLLHRLHLLLNIVANVNERTTFKREEVVII